MDFQSVFLQHVSSAEIALFIKFLCQIEKKVVGSAQKLRVGRGALNTAFFFFWPYQRYCSCHICTKLFPSLSKKYLPF